MKMPWKIALVVSLTLAAAGINALSSKSPETGRNTKVSNTAEISGLLRAPLPGRAVPQGDASTYDAENLYQYIDGGADIYLLYDFKTLLHQDFKSAAAEVTVDIYQMGNPEDAFGIYSSERSTNYKFLPIGAEGYRAEGILNFLEGRYYVKLSGSGPSADALLDQFARLLSTRIGGSRALPSLLTSLPREHRIAHSEQYIKEGSAGPCVSGAGLSGYLWGRKRANKACGFRGAKCASRESPGGTTDEAFQTNRRSGFCA